MTRLSQARALCSWPSTLVLLFILVGAIQIVSTYDDLSQTWDEPFHIAAGMEWIQFGTYRLEQLHPPLGRIAAAVGPFIAGKRLAGPFLAWQDGWDEGNRLLHADNYVTTLALARLGILPFFLLSAWIVWMWSRTLGGNVAGVFAVALFTSVPPVLAHAGLATTDAAGAATLTAALFAFTRWLDRPGWSMSCILGAAMGLAILGKFSNVAFLPACLAAVLVLRALQWPGSLLASSEIRRRLVGSLVVVLFAFAVVWAGYRFSLSPLTPVDDRPHTVIDEQVGATGLLHNVAYAVVESSVFPLMEVFNGLRMVAEKSASGHNSYFLGGIPKTGSWYFFPTILGVKTPVPLLILAIVAIVLLTRHCVSSRDWRLLEPAAVIFAILAVSMSSNINMGTRHVLGIYSPLAIVAGAGVAALWQVRRFRLSSRVGILVLLIWQGIATIATGPDYLAYFNAFAGGNPERIVVDSDLDWGQDVHRLSRALDERDVDKIHIAYHGTADLTRHDLPALVLLTPNQPVVGWVAISISELKIEQGFQWLECHTPVALVGKSIRLYYIAAGQPSGWQEEAR